MDRPDGTHDAQRRFAWIDIEEALIEGLPCSKFVRRLLMALWKLWRELPEPYRVSRNDGSCVLDPAREQIAAKLGKSVPTVWRYVREALGTPYLQSDSEPPKTTIYVLCWPMIFDHSDEALGRARLAGRPPKSRHGTDRRRLSDVAVPFQNRTSTVSKSAGLPFQKRASTVSKSGVLPFQNGGPTVSNETFQNGAATAESNDAPSTCAKCSANGTPDATCTCKKHVNMSHVGHVDFKVFPQEGPVVVWPARIEKAHLRNPRAVDELYWISRAWGNVAEGDRARLEFFAAARRALRADVPGAAFTSNVKAGRWDQAGIEDERWAADVIRQLERERRPPPDAAAKAAAQGLSVPDNLFADTRDRDPAEEAAALRARFAGR